MRILYLAHRIPYPPDKGDKIRAYHQIRHLARDHEIDLCTLIDDPADRRHVTDLRELCARVTAIDLPPRRARLRAGLALLSGRPFSPAFFREPELARRVAEQARATRYDAVVLFCSAMGGLLPPELVRSGVPILADYCDLDSAKWRALARAGNPARRLAFAREGRALARHEARLGRRCRAVVFATPLEAEDFLALPGGGSAADVRVIANGVDHARFARGAGAPSATPSVVFTGAMDYLPNHLGALWFIDRVWPRIHSAMPCARLRVVGRDPRRDLLRRDGTPGLEITGTVPDVRPYLHEAWLAVAPLRVARGVQNKVLEAMAAGVPTLISPAVSRGLEARGGEETLVADGEEAWAATVLRLLLAPCVRKGLARNGLEYVRRNHDWEAHGRSWDALLAEATAAPAARRGAA